MRRAAGRRFPKTGRNPAHRTAGILPPGSSGIGVILTTGVAPYPIVVSEVLADGRVIFAVKAQESAEPSGPRKASIKAITWTNADGTPGRMNVTQKQR